MANTFSQITIQAVFAVKGRQNLITTGWRNRLHEYISGTIKKEGVKSLAVGGWKDHVHILFGLPPVIRISDFINIIKSNSSKWINEQNFLKNKFHWQEGYGVFSYSRDQRDSVIKYIMNQEEHHRKITFREEYSDLLNHFNIEFDEKYVFEFYE